MSAHSKAIDRKTTAMYHKHSMQPKADILKIRKILKWVWENPNSSFYRGRYKKAGIKSWKEIKTIEDFEKLPYLTREDIEAVDPFDRVFLPKNKINTVNTTSATSSGKPLVLLSEVYDSDFTRIGTDKEKQAKYLKDNKIERMLFMEPVVAFSRRLQFYSTIKQVCQVFGDIHNLPLSAKVASSAKIQAIFTSSTILLFFTPYLKAEYDLKNIKLIMIGGEYCSKQRLRLLKKMFPKAVFYFHYGSTEAPSRGYMCENLLSKNPNLFHWSPNFHGEITDEGELVLTSFLKTMFPVIRYRTGDSIRFKKTPCACGSKDALFEIIGRAGTDSLNIQGTTINVDSVMKAIRDISGVSQGDFKLHVYEKIEKDKIMPRMVLELVKTRESSSPTSIEDTISGKLYLSARITLSDLVEKGIFKPLEVKLVSQLPFEPKRKYIVLHND